MHFEVKRRAGNVHRESMTTLGHRAASLLERDYTQTLAIEFIEAREAWLMLISDLDRTQLSGRH